MDFLFNLVDPTIFEAWAQDALSHQFTQMTIAFALAAWIHGNKVKKEIKLAFKGLTSSIDNIAIKMTHEMAGIKREIHILNERVDNIEKFKIEGVSNEISDPKPI